MSVEIDDNLSDEEFAQAMESGLNSTAASDEPEYEEGSDEPSDIEGGEEALNQEEESEEPDTDEEQEEGEESDEEEEPEEESGEESEESDESEEDEVEEDEDTAENDDVPEEYRDAVKNSKEFEKILAPFKANGKTMSVDNADEAVKLMKMGANYVKKMTVLKPRLNRVKALEENDLLDDDKFNQLIDISKGDKTAIAAFLKSNEIDPVTLLDEESDGYKPNSYEVDESREALVETLESIKEDAPEQYGSLVKDVINEWDNASKNTFGENPKVLGALVENMQIQLPDGSTVFSKVNNELNKQRALGNYVGQSDLEAYFAIGQAMFGDQAEQGKPRSEVNKKQLPPKSKKANTTEKDTEKRKKRLAVNKGSGAGATSRKTKPPKAEHQMTDDEFEAYMNQHLNG